MSFPPSQMQYVGANPYSVPFTSSAIAPPQTCPFPVVHPSTVPIPNGVAMSPPPTGVPPPSGGPPLSSGGPLPPRGGPPPPSGGPPPPSGGPPPPGGGPPPPRGGPPPPGPPPPAGSLGGPRGPGRKPLEPELSEEEKKLKLKRETQKALQDIVCASELSTQQARNKVVETWMAKFEDKEDKLKQIVDNYPKEWEKGLFNSLDPNEAKKWRDKKWMQIADTEEEKIPEQIKLVHNAIEKERKLQEQKEKEKELNDRKGDLLEEMKRRFEREKAKEEERELDEMEDDDDEVEIDW